jgi:peptidoglycan hydrolase-like protein with peptidoglycan-binding domain
MAIPAWYAFPTDIVQSTREDTLAMGLNIDDIPFGWVRKELRLVQPLQRGATGKAVQRVQEWLTLNGIAVVVDGQFGPATGYAVGRFQTRRGLPKSGVVDTATFDELTEPLHRALAPPSTVPGGFSSGVANAARQHLRERPREVGGGNRGPWVRVYMEGADGPGFLWCAGFVSFLVRQAAWQAGVELPMRPTFSCDVISQDALTEGRFISETDSAAALDDLPRGSFFVQRRSPTDWTHVGIVVAAVDEIIETIEGNTNEGGTREGYEVCRRIRNLKNKDFVTLEG